MKAVEPAELSAYLDGELSSERMAEIDAALTTDANLRAEFEALKSADIQWKAAAKAATFHPEVQLPESRAQVFTPVMLAVIVVTLIALRMIPKFADMMVFAIALHAIALVSLLPWLADVVLEDAPASE
ncbi:MAG TPA: zf-HC2 domain-containing protein [Pseudohongiella sp.]|nr:zf-HC2 domain-containing protein [Pseudohongiella sp.]